MNSFSYLVPTKVIFGKDSLEFLTDELKPYNTGKILVLYGSGSVIKNGILKQVTDKLDKTNLKYITKGGVKANPMLSFANEIRDLCVKEGVDFILAVGGGSVIDTAKAVSVGIKDPDSNIWDYFSQKKVPTASIPVATVLTISAAGSETSDSCVLTNDDTCKKIGLGSPIIRPKFSILNPEFTYTLPKYQVACGIVDILMHTMDRYFAGATDNEITDQIAEGLMRTVIMYAKTLFENPTDYKASSEIMWCGSLSHSDITGLGAIKDFTAHKLSHGISGTYDTAHGAALAITWSGFANYIYKNNPERFARFSKNVWNLSCDDEVKLAKMGIDKTTELFKSLSMPTSFIDLFGKPISNEEIEALVNFATENKTIQIGSLNPLDATQVREIYELLNK